MAFKKIAKQLKVLTNLSEDEKDVNYKKLKWRRLPFNT